MKSPYINVYLPEVICSWFLTESRSRHDADAGVLQKLERVEDVGGLADRFGLLDGFGGKMNLKKE